MFLLFVGASRPLKPRLSSISSAYCFPELIADALKRSKPPFLFLSGWGEPESPVGFEKRSWLVISEPRATDGSPG